MRISYVLGLHWLLKGWAECAPHVTGVVAEMCDREMLGIDGDEVVRNVRLEHENKIGAVKHAL